MEALCMPCMLRIGVDSSGCCVFSPWLPRIKRATSVIKLAQPLRVKQYDFQLLSWQSLGVSLRCGIWDFFGSAGTSHIFLLLYLAAAPVWTVVDTIWNIQYHT